MGLGPTQEVADIERLLDVANDNNLEVKVLEALIRKGYLRENGTVSVDLLPLLQDASTLAFGEPLPAPSSACARNDWCVKQFRHHDGCSTEFFK